MNIKSYFASLALILCSLCAYADSENNYTPLSRLYDLDENDPVGTFNIREHEPIYFLPAWYNHSRNGYPSTPTRGQANYADHNRKNVEAKMQISFKTKLAQDLLNTPIDVWFGYTQVSHWQVYDSWSAPFRNTDYRPEIFATMPVSFTMPWKGKMRMIGVGVVHQSNGQSEPLSRSWNRLYARAGFEWKKLTIVPQIEYRVPEKEQDDDNPDLVDYVGHGSIEAHYRFGSEHSIRGKFRFNTKTGKSGTQLDYYFPIAGRLQGTMQLFHGYGENLLDYNHRQTSVGLGLTFNGWDGF